MNDAFYGSESAHSRIALIRHIVEIVAIVAAGIWAFYTFIYEERIKPAHEPLASVETVTMDREGRIRNLDIIRVKIAIRNVGKTEFDSVAANLEVFGYRYGHVVPSANITHDSYHAADVAPAKQKHLVFSVVQLYDAAINGQRDLHNIVDPGSETGHAYLIAIPHGRYDLLHAKFQYLPFKTPVPRHFAVNVTRLTGGGFNVTEKSGSVLEDNVESELALTQ